MDGNFSKWKRCNYNSKLTHSTCCTYEQKQSAIVLGNALLGGVKNAPFNILSQDSSPLSENCFCRYALAQDVHLCRCTWLSLHWLTFPSCLCISLEYFNRSYASPTTDSDHSIRLPALHSFPYFFFPLQNDAFIMVAVGSFRLRPFNQILLISWNNGDLKEYTFPHMDMWSLIKMEKQKLMMTERPIREHSMERVIMKHIAVYFEYFSLTFPGLELARGAVQPSANFAER